MTIFRVLDLSASSEPSEEVCDVELSGSQSARKNAQKHGLTGELSSQSVREWYRVIVNDPTVELPLLEQVTSRQRLALNLAQAEVRLRQTLEVVAAFECERDPLFEERANLLYDYRQYLRFARNRSFDQWTREASKILMRIIAKSLRQNEREIKKRARLLERYKSEAYSKQRSAQKAWCDLFKSE